MAGLDLGTLTAGLRLDSGQFVSGVKSAKRATGDFNREAKPTKGHLAGMAKAAIGAAAAFGSLYAAITTVRSSINAFADFESKMIDVKNIAGAVGDDFDRLNAKALEMGRTTAYTAAEAAGGMKFLAMAGQDTAEVLGSIGPAMELAGAAGLELAQSADIVTNVMSAFQIGVEDLGKTNDILVNTFTNSNQSLQDVGDLMKKVGPMANTVGISLESIAAASGVLADQGQRAGEAGRGLRRVLAGLAKPTREGKDAMKLLGVTLDDVKDGFGPFAMKLQEAKQRLGETQFLAETLRAFDIFGGPIAASLAEGGEKIAEMDEALKNTGISAKMFQEQMDSTKGSIVKLTSAWDGLLIKMGDEGSPIVKKMADWMIKLIGHASDGVDIVSEFTVGVNSLLEPLTKTSDSVEKTSNKLTLLQESVLKINAAFGMVMAPASHFMALVASAPILLGKGVKKIWELGFAIKHAERNAKEYDGQSLMTQFEDGISAVGEFTEEMSLVTDEFRKVEKAAKIYTDKQIKEWKKLQKKAKDLAQDAAEATADMYVANAAWLAKVTEEAHAEGMRRIREMNDAAKELEGRSVTGIKEMFGTGDFDVEAAKEVGAQSGAAMAEEFLNVLDPGALGSLLGSEIGSALGGLFGAGAGAAGGTVGGGIGSAAGTRARFIAASLTSCSRRPRS